MVPVLVDGHDVREVSVSQRIQRVVALETPKLAGHLEKLVEGRVLGYLEVCLLVLVFVGFASKKLLTDGTGHFYCNTVTVDAVKGFFVDDT